MQQHVLLSSLIDFFKLPLRNSSVLFPLGWLTSCTECRSAQRSLKIIKFISHVFFRKLFSSSTSSWDFVTNVSFILSSSLYLPLGFFSLPFPGFFSIFSSFLALSCVVVLLPFLLPSLCSSLFLLLTSISFLNPHIPLLSSPSFPLLLSDLLSSFPSPSPSFSFLFLLSFSSSAPPPPLLFLLISGICNMFMHARRRRTN